ncbi:hypothetical protein RJT34_11218 [Clitoria ternatea]|uniref:LYK3/RLK10-like LysM domain-containing protein n=1 Tax=Clitoria ternatea TaxID=43366 RepID=A0AAN9JLI3_CLITE
MNPKFRLSVFLLFWASEWFSAKSTCFSGCDALASYYLWRRSNLTYVSRIMQSQVLSSIEDIISYNKDYSVSHSSRVNVPIPCNCINGEFLANFFQYTTQPYDTYLTIAEIEFSNLSTDDWIMRFNSYSSSQLPQFRKINVTVNCSCGNSEVSKDYGLFITYPLRTEDTLESIANQTKLPPELLQRYNPGVDFGQGSGLVYIPGKGKATLF